MQVYVIADAGIEHYAVQHVCISEETARKRFDDVRVKLLNEAIRMHKWCEKEDKREGRDWRDNTYDENVEVLEKTTFDNVESMLFEHPVWTTYELEE